MSLRELVRLLRIRKTLILVFMLVGIGVAAALTLNASPLYSAKARLFVSTDDVSDVAGAYQGSAFAQQRVKSYAAIVDSPTVTKAVIDELRLDLSHRAIAKRVSATAPLDTVLLDVTASDRSPVVAQRLANAVAQNFTRLVTELERTNARGEPLVKVSVVQPAELPTSPVSPRKNVNLSIGFLVGLMAGVGAAVARETLDTSVKSGDDLQDLVGVTTLGVIAFDADAPRKPLIVHDSPNSPRAEAFRQLRTNLQFVDVDERPRSIVVTSSVPQEGKTTTTCNLALTIAQAGAPVILIDGDLRRPKVGEYLGLDAAIGLTDVLIGRVSIEDALQPWGDGRLQVLLSGPHPPNPSELLGSRHMAELLRSLERRALVIIDAPPLLPVTDAAVLAADASGTVMVVASGRTSRDQVSQAVGTLRSVGGNIFGAVINMAPAKGPDSARYGYGYGYGTSDKA